MELWALKALDIYLNPLYTIDIVKAAQYLLHLCRRCSLEKLLFELEIPFTALHNSGNDAPFCPTSLPDACSSGRPHAEAVKFESHCPSSTAKHKS